MDGTDFLIEERLHQVSPKLHQKYRNSVFAIDRMLNNYRHMFPLFTNHAFEHSEQVINNCNIIGGDNIKKLNGDELYILLMSASLHDVGMGISEKDFLELKHEVQGLEEFERNFPGMGVRDLTRAFHNELSACLIRKYEKVFEIPTSDHTYCIGQISKGHRKVSLSDSKEFERRFIMDNGQVVRLPYISALIRLADDLDIASDRNLFFTLADMDETWDAQNIMCRKGHEAVTRLEFSGDTIIAYCRSDEEAVQQFLKKLEEKLGNTLNIFLNIVDAYDELDCKYRNIVFKAY